MIIDFTELQNEIVTDLTIELQDDDDFNAAKLSNKVKLAIKEIISKRNYGATSYTEEMILSDLYNYYSMITNVARYDYNQIGAEGQFSHSENGTNRTWVKRDELFKGLVAFVDVI